MLDPFARDLDPTNERNRQRDKADTDRPSKAKQKKAYRMRDARVRCPKCGGDGYVWKKHRESIR